jgi:anti-sigma B factor antagonist
MTTVNPSAEIASVLLPSHFDSGTSASVERTLIGALRPRGKLIVDGSPVVYMSAAGVRALATVLHAAEAMEAHVVFCSFRGPAADCLEVSGFAQLLDVVASAEEARGRLVARTVERFAERLHVRRGAR